MPDFCGSCGAAMDLSISDVCPNCGTKAGKGGSSTKFVPAEASGETATFGLNENIAGACCYALWWLTGIIFILVEKENKVVRFHAMQSILTFVPLGILGWILGLMAVGSGYYTVFNVWSAVGTLLTIIEIILWLVLMYKAYMGEQFMVPIVGPIAARQLE